MCVCICSLKKGSLCLFSTCSLLQQTLVCSIVKNQFWLYWYLLQLMQSVVSEAAKDVRILAHVTPVFYKLHWLPDCLRMQFKVMVVALKALHGFWAGNIWDNLSSIASTCPIWSKRNGMLWVSLAKECQPVGLRTHMELHSSWDQISLTLLAFCKALKNWPLCLEV